jgi:hypothetical protein
VAITWALHVAESPSTATWWFAIRCWVASRPSASGRQPAISSAGLIVAGSPPLSEV